MCMRSSFATCPYTSIATCGSKIGDEEDEKDEEDEEQTKESRPWITASAVQDG